MVAEGHEIGNHTNNHKYLNKLDAAQIREQIQAVYDAGYEEWILWNATNRYSPDGLLAAGEEKQ